MTEDQAKTRWCFMSRWIKLNGELTSNQPNDEATQGIPAGNCIASGCMAWRPVPNLTGHGLCGLAGPQEVIIARREPPRS